MNTTQMKLLGVWSGVAFCALWGGGLLLTGWIPPMPPNLEAEAVATLVQNRSLQILLGVAFMTCFAVLYLPWTITLSEIIRPIEAPGHFLAQTQLLSGLMAQVTFFIPPYLFAAAAYRPFRNPEVTQALLDVGWLMFITGIGPFILQYTALAIAIFADKREVPAFPRWVGYLQVWISVSFICALIPFFLKSGPFSWNGMFVWWVPASIFAIWFVGMIIFARKAVLRDSCSEFGKSLS